MKVQDYANDDPPSTRFDTIGDALKSVSVKPPIDAFILSVREVITFGTPAKLLSNDFLGRLLVLSVVSAGEAYFRSVMAASIEMCPICRSNSAERSVHLGGLLWHGTEGYSRSAFEHASFASVKELKKTSRDFLGFELRDAEFQALLDEYEKVCQLRHGIVHSDGYLPGKNAVQLEVPPARSPQRIVVRYEHLQELAAVVSNLVVSFNRELFAEMCNRWAHSWRSRADWEPADEEKRFGRIWSTFHSREELKSRAGRSRITRAKCLELVKAENGI